MSLLNIRQKEVSILITDDEGIREINRLYLNRDYPTNVISFPQLTEDFSMINPHVLGDIVISVETAAKEAKKGNFSLDDELDYLFLHGILHLLGYNHENTSPAERKRMYRLTKKIFNELKGFEK